MREPGAPRAPSPPKNHATPGAAMRAERNTVDFGVNLPIFGDDPAPVIETAVLAEELGYANVWMGDHIVQPIVQESVYPYSRQDQRGIGEMPSYMDVFVGMTAVAMKTSRIRVGTSVLIVPYRNPIHTARLLATVDTFSGGRLDVGCGVGWSAEEFAALGVPFANRGGRTNEYLDIYRKLWTEDPVSYSGKFYQFEQVSFKPKPVQAGGPPIWIGGNSDAAMKRAVTHGAGWQPINLSLEQMTAAKARLNELCVEHGRAPESLRIILNRGVLLYEEERPARPADPERPYAAFVGGPQAMIEEAKQYADLGVEQIHCHFVARDQAAKHAVMARFMDTVAPHVR